MIVSRSQGVSSRNKAVEIIVWDLRLPRALLAVVVGVGFGIAGCAIQTLVRNPLTDPYPLNVSPGTFVGATAVITFDILSGFGLWSTLIGALFDALGAALAVYLVATAQGGLTLIRLVLIEVVLPSAFSIVASFLIFKGPGPRTAQLVLYWLLGSVSGAQQDWPPLVTGVVAICLVLPPLGSGWFDALTQGPNATAVLGIPVGVLRQGLFLLLAVLVGVLMVVSGGIGSVGLAIPHLRCMMIGSLYRRLLPVAAAVDGLFLLWVGALLRVTIAPVEMSLGVVTGPIGVSALLIIISRRSYGFEGSS